MCCWPRDCQRRVSSICATDRTTPTAPARSGCTRLLHAHVGGVRLCPAGRYRAGTAGGKGAGGDVSVGAKGRVSGRAATTLSGDWHGSPPSSHSSNATSPAIDTRKPLERSSARRRHPRCSTSARSANSAVDLAVVPTTQGAKSYCRSPARNRRNALNFSARSRPPDPRSHRRAARAAGSPPRARPAKFRRDSHSAASSRSAAPSTVNPTDSTARVTIRRWMRSSSTTRSRLPPSVIPWS
jgi:hypothetical protein